jgi:hypothetical protein
MELGRQFLRRNTRSPHLFNLGNKKIDLARGSANMGLSLPLVWSWESGVSEAELIWSPFFCDERAGFCSFGEGTIERKRHIGSTSSGLLLIILE